MYLQPLIDLYWSKDFLLNITAEAVGVVSEVVLVTVIISRYLDRKELQRWKITFSRRIQKLLDVHGDMPNTIGSMELAGDVNICYKISMWSDIAKERLRDALALVPPKLTDPGYLAAEEYLQAIRDLSREFINQKMSLTVLRTLNSRAETLAQVTALANPEGYLWTEDFLRSLEPQLREAEW